MKLLCSIHGLGHQLLKAIPKDAQVIFVGDQDQLPPVGPGQVLKDLLASKRIPTVELKDIYRQAEGSSIIELAHEMKQGRVPAITYLLRQRIVPSLRLQPNKFQKS